MDKKAKLQNFLTQNWQRIVVVLAIISLIAIASWVLKQDPNLASSAVALGTLTLALVTVLSIFIANDREKRHRKNELDRERRDRKERYLNEITQWANDVNTRVYDISMLTGKTYEEERNTVWILSGLSNKGRYIKAIAENIFGNPLKDSIKDTGNEMGIYAETLRYFVDHKFEIVGMPTDERDRLVAELSEAIVEDNRNSRGGIPNTAMSDAIKMRCAESMRDKATITLDICATLKADLLKP